MKDVQLNNAIEDNVLKFDMLEQSAGGEYSARHVQSFNLTTRVCYGRLCIRPLPCSGIEVFKCIGSSSQMRRSIASIVDDNTKISRRGKVLEMAIKNHEGQGSRNEFDPFSIRCRLPSGAEVDPPIVTFDASTAPYARTCDPGAILKHVCLCDRSLHIRVCSQFEICLNGCRRTFCTTWSH